MFVRSMVTDDIIWVHAKEAQVYGHHNIRLFPYCYCFYNFLPYWLDQCNLHSWSYLLPLHLNIPK